MGSAGFIAGYLVQELLDQGHHVIGIDNYSKYGAVEKSYQNHPNYCFVQGEFAMPHPIDRIGRGLRSFCRSAARIGGISHFLRPAGRHERIIAASFDAAIHAHKNHRLQKVTVLSSSMVFENATLWPTPELIWPIVRRHQAPMVFSWPAIFRQRVGAIQASIHHHRSSIAWELVNGARWATKIFPAAT